MFTCGATALHGWRTPTPSLPIYCAVLHAIRSESEYQERAVPPLPAYLQEEQQEQHLGGLREEVRDALARGSASLRELESLLSIDGDLHEALHGARLLQGGSSTDHFGRGSSWHGHRAGAGGCMVRVL
jgi:hypothetical protein